MGSSRYFPEIQCSRDNSRFLRVTQAPPNRGNRKAGRADGEGGRAGGEGGEGGEGFNNNSSVVQILQEALFKIVGSLSKLFSRELEGGLRLKELLEAKETKAGTRENFY